MKQEGSSKHVHRTPISIDNPELKGDNDWWDDVCKAHGAKNYWPKNKVKKEQQSGDERKVSGK
jgi:hypothetical protein